MPGRVVTLIGLRHRPTEAVERAARAALLAACSQRLLGAASLQAAGPAGAVQVDRACRGSARQQQLKRTNGITRTSPACCRSDTDRVCLHDQGSALNERQGQVWTPAACWVPPQIVPPAAINPSPTCDPQVSTYQQPCRQRLASSQQAGCPHPLPALQSGGDEIVRNSCHQHCQSDLQAARQTHNHRRRCYRRRQAISSSSPGVECCGCTVLASSQCWLTCWQATAATAAWMAARL